MRKKIVLTSVLSSLHRALPYFSDTFRKLLLVPRCPQLLNSSQAPKIASKLATILNKSNPKLRLLAFCLLLSMGLGIERLYTFQNAGFSIAKVTSKQTPSSSTIANQEIADTLLNQSFRFIGSGGTSFVFLGEDEKTILKLFKHQHLIPNSFFWRFTLPGMLDAWRVGQALLKEQRHAHKRQSFFFKSCTLAEQKLKEETGLLFLCLEPNVHFTQKLTLKDAWGFSRQLDLQHAEFALQKKASPLFPTLERLLDDETKAKRALDALLQLVRQRCAKGIGDRDPNLLINFGFVDSKAIEFDLGSYFANEYLCSTFATAQELFLVTLPLQVWLKERSPELENYLLTQISQTATLPEYEVFP